MTESSSPKTPPTRRRVLQTLVGAGGLLATDLLPGLGASALTASGSHLRLLNLAATTTALGLTFYHIALTRSEFHIGETATRQLEGMLATQRQDAGRISALGGQVLTRSVLLPSAVGSDASVFVQTGLHLERASAHFYLSATHDLAAHNKPGATLLLARLAAQAAQRQIQLAHLAGLGDEEATLGSAVISTPEALSALTTYLGRPRDGFRQVDVFA